MNPSTRTKAQTTASRWGHVWMALLILCLGGVGWRLVYIQQHLSPQLEVYRESQQIRTVPIPPQRGMIFDARGRLLAGSTMKPSVYIDPQMIKSEAGWADQLSPILGTSPETLLAEMTAHSQSRFVWLSRKISPAEAYAVKKLNLSGVGIIDEPHRYYPNLKQVAHILGFVNSEGEGLEGLELEYNKTLTGVAGQYKAYCDSRRRLLWSDPESTVEPIDGNHLTLTIDLVIQGYLETAIQEAITQYKAESGVGIVMDPRSGAVLAMACLPTFDPNLHQEFPGEVKRNRCLTDPVEPGSVFKPFILAGVLADGQASLHEKIDCENGLHYFGKRPIRDTHRNGVISVEEVLVQSSNIGMAKLGTRLGNKRLHHYITGFGFGEKTQIDLPGENRGMVLPIKKWTSLSCQSVSFGQELAITPIQLITALSTLVNGGKKIQPHVVHSILKANGESTRTIERPLTNFQVIPEKIARAVAQQAMVSVVKESPNDIRSDRYQILGKTGTAQVPYRNRRGYEPEAYLSSFMGAAPAHDPQVAVLIMIRKPKASLGYYGGKVSGPAVRDVINQILAYWEVPANPTLPERQVVLQRP